MLLFDKGPILVIDLEGVPTPEVHETAFEISRAHAAQDHVCFRFGHQVDPAAVREAAKAGPALIDGRFEQSGGVEAVEDALAKHPYAKLLTISIDCDRPGEWSDAVAAATRNIEIVHHLPDIGLKRAQRLCGRPCANVEDGTAWLVWNTSPDAPISVLCSYAAFLRLRAKDMLFTNDEPRTKAVIEADAAQSFSSAIATAANCHNAWGLMLNWRAFCANPDITRRAATAAVYEVMMR